MKFETAVGVDVGGAETADAEKEFETLLLRINRSLRAVRGIGEVVRATFGNENIEMCTLLALRGSGLICVACTPMCACARTFCPLALLSLVETTRCLHMV